VVADLLNTCAVALRGKPDYTVEQVRTDWQDPTFAPARDARVIVAADGSLVGLAALYDASPHVRPWALGEVHPRHVGRGLGSALADWLELRGRQVVACAPVDARVVLVQDRDQGDTCAQELLASRGYRLTRHSLRMERLLVGDVPEPHLPLEIALRPFVRGQEERAVIGVICEAFRDHWGWVERPFEDELGQWLYYLNQAPDADPSLWFVATSGGQIVGTCLCHPTMAEDPDMAYIFGLAVLRPWRRQGIALALLEHALSQLAGRGKRRVGLQVDAENLTGALGLYRRAGMSVTRQDDTWEKVLRPGRDLSTQALPTKNNLWLMTMLLFLSRHLVFGTTTVPGPTFPCQHGIRLRRSPASWIVIQHRNRPRPLPRSDDGIDQTPGQLDLIGAGEKRGVSLNRV
jgi:mycothiol synthase